MKLNMISLDLRELTSDEALEINAGESAWYWFAFGIGSVGRGIKFMWNYAAEHPEDFIA